MHNFGLLSLSLSSLVIFSCNDDVTDLGRKILLLDVTRTSLPSTLSSLMREEREREIGRLRYEVRMYIYIYIYRISEEENGVEGLESPFTGVLIGVGAAHARLLSIAGFLDGPASLARCRLASHNWFFKRSQRRPCAYIHTQLAPRSSLSLYVSVCRLLSSFFFLFPFFYRSFL